MSGLVPGSVTLSNFTQNYEMCPIHNDVNPPFEPHEKYTKELNQSYRDCSKLIEYLGILQEHDPQGTACIDFSNCKKLTDRERKIIVLNEKRCQKSSGFEKFIAVFLVGIVLFTRVIQGEN